MPDELVALAPFPAPLLPALPARVPRAGRAGPAPHHPVHRLLRLAAGVPHLLTDSGPGELFVVRNVGNFVPPWDASLGYHGTCAAIEFAVLNLGVRDIVVCGHRHCGAIRALYEDPPRDAPHLAKWLQLGHEACLPVRATPEALRRTEQRSIALQLERLLQYPIVAARVERGELFLHGWHYVIEDGQVMVLDVARGAFVLADQAGSGDDGHGPLDLLQ